MLNYIFKQRKGEVEKHYLNNYIGTCDEKIKTTSANDGRWIRRRTEWRNGLDVI